MATQATTNLVAISIGAMAGLFLVLALSAIGLTLELAMAGNIPGVMLGSLVALAMLASTVLMGIWAGKMSDSSEEEVTDSDG